MPSTLLIPGYAVGIHASIFRQPFDRWGKSGRDETIRVARQSELGKGLGVDTSIPPLFWFHNINSNPPSPTIGDGGFLVKNYFATRST